MSLPAPHIQSLSSYRSEWRASSSNRDVSSPFSLAIPPRRQRRSTQRADTPTQYLDSPEKTRERISARVTERPIRPKPYTLNGGSTSTMLSQYQPGSSYTRKEEPKKPRMNDHVLAFGVTFAIAILLAIIIPLAAILPQKYLKPLPISRLYDTVVKYRDTRFTVVVSLSNGPGNFTWPPATYIDAIKKLKVFPNMQTLGYIDTSHGNATNTTVRAQIATYAGWQNVTEGLALHDIYFDQTPWEDDDEGVAAAYLRNVSVTVRHTDGWAGPGEGLVMHNPGRVPDVGLMADRPDMVVVYEGIYDNMPSRETLHAQVREAKGDRKDFAMLVRSIPNDLGRGGLRKVVERVRRDVQWLIRAHPNLRFLCTINPHNGPGYPPWWMPNEDYAREIPKLNGYKNVQTVGYVRADYCKRPASDVELDILTYASRPTIDENAELAMNGIFVDEVVNVYSDQVMQYLDSVDRCARQSKGIRGDQIVSDDLLARAEMLIWWQVIHNPGTAVEKPFANANPGPDISVVVETSYAEFNTTEYQAWLANSPYVRSRTCYMLYSVPEEKVAELVVSLRDRAKYLFLTSATSRFYENFGSSWEAFVKAMADGGLVDKCM
ncbi:hypothetical protein CC86DRAFT_392221 [Ophiobolus disseminans]|uniref:Uncharacterized protein n=1 Tax=Ophiobolus disseminans TaxID=1469910 RepID=A0A6A7A8M7_9PLEO|nr:hypothetical protein CC86DRAFT_392221 [Ophiobolus disseminans]